MAHYINKDALVAKIERKIDKINQFGKIASYEVGLVDAYKIVLFFLDTLEVIDPYKRCVQHQSVKDGIKSHAETYSFNTDSALFPQLTKEQQKLWRKEIEYACISGGDMGYSLAKDPRYKENHEVKEVDLNREIDLWVRNLHRVPNFEELNKFARHFFELGIKSSQRGEKV